MAPSLLAPSSFLLHSPSTTTQLNLLRVVKEHSSHCTPSDSWFLNAAVTGLSQILAKIPVSFTITPVGCVTAQQLNAHPPPLIGLSFTTTEPTVTLLAVLFSIDRNNLPLSCFYSCRSTIDLDLRHPSPRIYPLSHLFSHHTNSVSSALPHSFTALPCRNRSILLAITLRKLTVTDSRFPKTNSTRAPSNHQDRSLRLYK